MLISFVAESAYVLAMYLWVALPLMPDLLPIVPVAYILAITLHRRRPAVLVLRRFGMPKQDLDLVQIVAPATVMFARMWWLGDRMGIHPMTRVKRFTATAAVALFVISGATGTMLVDRGWPTFSAAIAAICAALGTWILLEAFAANRYGVALFFFTVAGALLSSTRIELPAVTVPPPVRGGHATVTAIALSFLWIRAYRHKNHLDLGKLEREARSKWIIFPRYLLNAPVLASEVYASDSDWQPAVEQLLPSSRAVILDLTYLDRSAEGLRWEIERCARSEIDYLLVCHVKRAEEIRSLLGSSGEFGLTAPRIETYDARGLPAPVVHALLRRIPSHLIKMYLEETLAMKALHDLSSTPGSADEEESREQAGDQLH